MQKWKKYILLLKRALGIPYVNRIIFLLFVYKNVSQKNSFCIYEWKLRWLPSSKDNGPDYLHIYTTLFRSNVPFPSSNRALIWVHFKTVHYFNQPIFSLFSYLKNALHNLVIELCSAPFFSKLLYSYLLNSRTVL